MKKREKMLRIETGFKNYAVELIQMWIQHVDK